jgi:hypothetical protein
MINIKKIAVLAIGTFILGICGIIIAIGGYYSQYLCNQTGYVCIKVKNHQTWETMWPDPQQRRIIMRVNRMSTELYPGLILAIPHDKSVGLMDLSPLPYNRDPSPTNVVIVDMSEQAFGAYDRAGYLVHWGPISGGKGYCPDIHKGCHTPFGHFSVYNKSNEHCKSTKFPVPKGGAPMPYCMYFHGGFALHGGDLPGYHASHGCVRLLYEDAEWLNNNFVEMGRGATRVIVQE